MTKRNLGWMRVLLFLFCSALAFAQAATQRQSEEEPGAHALTAAQEKNMQEYISLLRSDVRDQKAEIMGAMMQLSAEQAAKFWPIYNEYDKELTKVNDLRVSNIQDYAHSYDNMTGAKADELIRNAMNYRKQRADLLARYYDRVKAALGPIEAARFVQIEEQLLEIIDLQIASNLPVVTQSP